MGGGGAGGGGLNRGLSRGCPSETSACEVLQLLWPLQSQLEPFADTRKRPHVCNGSPMDGFDYSLDSSPTIVQFIGLCLVQS